MKPSRNKGYYKRTRRRSRGVGSSNTLFVLLRYVALCVFRVRNALTAGRSRGVRLMWACLLITPIVGLVLSSFVLLLYSPFDHPSSSSPRLRGNSRPVFRQPKSLPTQPKNLPPLTRSPDEPTTATNPNVPPSPTTARSTSDHASPTTPGRLSTASLLPCSDLFANCPRWSTRSVLAKSMSDLFPTPTTGPPDHVDMCSELFTTCERSRATVREQPARRDAVVDAFNHAWSGYKRNAFGHDGLKPVSGMSDDSWGELAMTLVDSLDTLFILGFHDEFDHAVDHLVEAFNLGEKDHMISVFETNIRVLGGLLAAFDVSGKHDTRILDLATQVGDVLLLALADVSTEKFSSTLINPKTRQKADPKWTHGGVVLADVGSLYVEMSQLSHHTNNDVYREQSYMFYHALLRTAQSGAQGLYPSLLHASNYQATTMSMGGLSDSFYEYLLKGWLLDGERDARLLRMYNEAVEAMDKHLINRFALDLTDGAPSDSRWAKNLLERSPPARLPRDCDHRRGDGVSTAEGQVHPRKLYGALLSDVVGGGKDTLNPEVGVSESHVLNFALLNGLLENDWDDDGSDWNDSDVGNWGGDEKVNGGIKDAPNAVGKDGVPGYANDVRRGAITINRVKMRLSGGAVERKPKTGAMRINRRKVTELTGESSSKLTGGSSLRRLLGATAFSSSKKDEISTVTQLGTPRRQLLSATDSGAASLHREYKTDHLSCFVPGMLALGAASASRIPWVSGMATPAQERPGTTPSTTDLEREKARLELRRAEDLELAKELMAGCIVQYGVNPSQLGGEAVLFNHLAALADKEQGDRTRIPSDIDQLFHVEDPKYLLRPEVAESLFVLFRVTGDTVYRDWGWQLFQAIRAQSETEYGFAAVEDVTRECVDHKDEMPSFFLAETLKYLYLLFSPMDELPLDRFVMSTEAHPLARGGK